MRTPIALVIWACLGWQCFCCAQTTLPTLVKATTNDHHVVVGGLLGETDEELQLFDLAKNKTVSLKKSDVIIYRKNISDSDAVLLVGPWRLLAWQIKQCVPTDKPTGRVAEVDGDTVYVTLGAGNSFAKDDELLVFREAGEIKDPVTGESLGTRRMPVAQVRVEEIREKYSKATVLDGSKGQPKIGDKVEPVRFNNAIGILPPVDADGDETVGGTYFAERLCAELVRNDLTIVERMLLGKAVDELVRQQGREFDEDTAEAVGRQVGAYAIATGSLSKLGNHVGVRLRLIEVATGKVVLTSTFRLSGKRFPELSDRKKVTKDELDLQAGAASVQGGKAELGDPADVPAHKQNLPRRNARRRGIKAIPAVIDKVVRLTRKEGPYKLDGHIMIGPKGALLLERGVVVYCLPHARINAEGPITSYGDDGFVMFRPVAPGVFWNSLFLAHGTEHVIEHFDIRGAFVGIDSKAVTQVRDSVIAQNKIGVSVGHAANSVTLTNCLIVNNLTDAIRISDNPVVVDHCTIMNNGGIGLFMTYGGCPRVTASNIVGNAVGFKSAVYGTNPEIHSCNIVGNKIAINVQTKEDFKCQNNYWGTDRVQMISAMIVDGYDKPERGAVKFEPFSSKPIAGAGCSLKIKR